LFQFMFVDCWPSISWSVVDYYRQPKKAFYALQASYEPILVSIRIKRRPLATFTYRNDVGWTYVLWDPRQVIWITNDTYNKYKNAKLVLKVEDESGKGYIRKVISTNIPRYSSAPVLTPIRFKPVLKIKGILEPGRYILRMGIWYRRKKISKNYEYFRITKRQEI